LSGLRISVEATVKMVGIRVEIEPSTPIILSSNDAQEKTTFGVSA
jgi:hypothetical protein